MDNYQKIVSQLDVFIKLDYENLTYQEMSEITTKIKILDQKLPSLDDLEVSDSKYQLTEVEKAKQALTDEILSKRSSFTPMEILSLIKSRVSIFSIFKLHDDLELNNAKITSELQLTNSKLEFLYRTLDKKSKKKK
jgi:hypothetical protein